MKRLFYLSGTLFFLSLTLLVGVQIGERSATAADTPAVVGFSVSDESNPHKLYVLLENGDVYTAAMNALEEAPQFRGNVWKVKGQ